MAWIRVGSGSTTLTFLKERRTSQESKLIPQAANGEPAVHLVSFLGANKLDDLVAALDSLLEEADDQLAGARLLLASSEMENQRPDTGTEPSLRILLKGKANYYLSS